MVDLKKIPDNHIVFFQSQDGVVHLEVMYSDENIRLSQKLMAELFGVTPQNITLHIKNIIDTGEIDVDSTCKDFLQVQNEWWREVKRTVKMYSLEATLALQEYEKYKIKQDQEYLSDFDKLVQNLWDKI